MPTGFIRAGLLLAPLIALLTAAFVMYGPEGPPDTPRVNAVAQLLGTVYGAYVVGMIVFWWKPWRRK